MAGIQVGAIFSSLSDLETAIGHYEQQKLVNLYKRSSRSIESHRKRCPNVAETANKDLVFAEINYCCIRGGKTFRSNGKGQRQAHHTTQQQCPAGLRIRLTKDATKLVVASVNEEHNHQMNEALFKYLPRQRRLDSSMEAETGRLLALHANKKLVQQHIREQGKEVTLKDLHNIKARTRPTHGSNLQSLLTEMQKDTGAVTELVVGSSNELVAISYQTTAMKNSQIRFPELLLLDATYKLNDLRMPLYVLMVVDGNGESVVIGLWIVANEERATISGLMDIFAKHNDTASIKCVMANKDMVERDVIREKLPVQPYRSACSTHCVRSVERLLQRSLASDLMSGWSASS
ncbi:hypothetical protein LSAT2_028325 [Lamellibrachia satsuma]|nr:hypothetical protein LSAT2_028325 [Lamellibrachia satsuma]